MERKIILTESELRNELISAWEDGYINNQTWNLDETDKEILSRRYAGMRTDKLFTEEQLLIEQIINKRIKF